MRRLVVSMMVSADGFIEGSGKDGDWFVWDGEMEEYMLGFLDSVDLLIYGRKAYQEMVAYWPTATQPIARLMNALPKLVFSRTLTGASWNNTRIVRTDITGELRKLKAQPGKDLVLFAGAEAASWTLNAGLVDHVRLLVNPVLLGRGKSVFGQLEERRMLRLSDTRRFSCGNVMLCYDVGVGANAMTGAH